LRFSLGQPFEDLWVRGVKITRVLDASPEEPKKLDFTNGSVRIAKVVQHIVPYAQRNLEGAALNFNVFELSHVR
jgi:hypothetical protein